MEAICKLIYEQNHFDLNKKFVSIWFFSEFNKSDSQSLAFLSLLNYLITSGANINIFINHSSSIDNLPTKSTINYFENKFDCLYHSETLIIYGKFLNFGTPNEDKIAEKMRTGLIIDHGCNFSLKCFMHYKITYLSF